jgi:hypothetical protein
LALAAASSLDKPDAIAAQNLLSSLRPATGGRPGERNGALPERSDRRFHLVIVAPHEALRRPLESAQYATLKAMGYRNAFLVKVVLQQAVLYALLGYVPAWIICYFVFKTVGEMVLIPAGMSIGLTALSAALTLSMCIGSALIAVRRVIAADPAELF